MKIFIDIGHPAHVHYFKNFIWIMEKKGHSIFICARDKEVAFRLLDKYGFAYFNRGKGGKSIIKKIFYLIKAIFIISRKTNKFKPDLFLSFASPYAAIVSWLFRKPHIAFDDTEHAKIEQKFFIPFSKAIFTPFCFYKNLGNKQIYFNSFMELCYLHPNYFKPDLNNIKDFDFSENKKNVLIRFVSWKASHDIGQKGMSYDFKKELIFELSKIASIFISSESELPEYLKPFQIKISPEKIHEVINSIDLYVGEGGTMASESAILGVPAIYINTLPLMGYLKEEKNNGLLFHFTNTTGVIEKAKELLQTPNLKEEFQKRRMKMLADKIDVTAFMVWFIENYPESAKIMKENPDYQNRFLTTS
jgi:predicted glycosyltransferase